MIGFAGAAVASDTDATGQECERVVLVLGEAAVIAGFDGITRVADATGIPIPPQKAELTGDFRGELGLHSMLYVKF